jgi:hypothetical protein
LKRFLLALFASAAVFAGCQKDTGTEVKIGQSDLSAINRQLAGTWVFPIQTQSVQDSTGKQLLSNQFAPAPAFQFDGSMHVTVMPDVKTKTMGTYTLSSVNGFIYLNISYADGTQIKYKVVRVDGQTLKLSTSQSINFEDVSAFYVSNFSYQKLNSADVTGSLVKVTIMSDSSFNAGIYVTHNVPAPNDTLTTVATTIKNTTGSYNYTFPANHGDYLKVDVIGSVNKTSMCIYYQGVPLTGKVDTSANEMTAVTGWIVP